MELGKKIKQLRQKAGWTQEDLGERLGIGAQAISKWENGITMPDIGQLPALAETFGVTIDDLFDLSVEQRFHRIESRLDVEDSLPSDVFLEYEAFLQEQTKDPRYKEKATSLIAYLYWHHMVMYGKEASRYAKQAIRDNPGKKDCQWILQRTDHHAAWDWNIENHAEAVEFYRELVKASPKEALPYRMLIDQLLADHRADEAERYLAILESLPRPNPVLESFYHAHIALARYQEREADALVESILAEHPDEEAALFEAAQYYAKKADYEKTIALYERSFANAKRCPRFTDELQAITDIYVIMGDYVKAADIVSRTMALLTQEWGIAESDDLRRLEEKRRALLAKA